MDLFDEKIARIWLLTDERRTPRRDVIGLFNWDEKEPVHISCPLAKIGLPRTGRYVGFDYWADEFVAPFEGSLQSDLPAASCRILAVRPVSGQPQVIGTSRHITQGIVDMLEETWDEKTQQLSGVSRVVANDPYEIRIAALGGATAWQVTGATVSAPDAAFRRQDPCGQTGGLESESPTRLPDQPGHPLDHPIFCAPPRMIGACSG